MGDASESNGVEPNASTLTIGVTQSPVRIKSPVGCVVYTVWVSLGPERFVVEVTSRAGFLLSLLLLARFRRIKGHRELATLATALRKGEASEAAA